MTNYKEILRLNRLGINNTRIAESLCCSRPTVIDVLHRARRGSLFWQDISYAGTAIDSAIGRERLEKTHLW